MGITQYGGNTSMYRILDEWYANNCQESKNILTVLRLIYTFG